MIHRTWSRGDRVYAVNGTVIHLVREDGSPRDGTVRTWCNREVDEHWQGEDHWAEREEQRDHICTRCRIGWPTLRPPHGVRWRGEGEE